MTIRLVRPRTMRITACVVAAAIAAWATSSSWAQPTSPPSPGATAIKPAGIHIRRPWRPPFDHDATAAYQRAREQYIATWGFAPGAQTQAVAASLPVTRWDSIGPFRIDNDFGSSSGRVNSIAIHPTNPSIIYVGAADGGVWKTTDGGADWLPLTDDQCTLEIGAVAIDPVNPSIVYAGTGDPYGFFDTPGGCGLLRSVDDGAHWSVIANTTTFKNSRVLKLLIDPATAGSTTTTTILAATNNGVLRSTNSGQTWTQVLIGGSTPTVTDIVFDPGNSQNVFAALGSEGNDPANGIYRSTDGGKTFPTKLGGGFPTTNVGAIKLDIPRCCRTTIYAAVQDLSEGGLHLLGIFKSTNSGKTWSPTPAFTGFLALQLPYDMTLNVDPSNANTFYFGYVSLVKSTDGGASFISLSGGSGPIHVDFHAFAFQPGNSSTIYTGNDGGIYKSTDGGSGWTSLNSGMAITQFYPGGALHPTDRNTAIAGSQDNGAVKYNGFATWTRMDCGDASSTAIDQSTPTTFYEVCGEVFRSDDAGSTWTQKITGINPLDVNSVFSLAMSPLNSQTLYLGSNNKVYKTTNRADNWIASGTTFGAIGQVLAIAPSPSDPNVIYIIVSAQGVFKSTNGNASYSAVNNGLPSFISPTALAVHPSDPNTAVVTMSGLLGSSFISEVFMTTDGGANWSNISGGNIPRVPLNAIVLDPTAPMTRMLIATDFGVFGTTNAGPGSFWAPASIGMPNVVVTDLKYNPATGVLLAFTFGRGAFKALLSPTTHDFNGDGNSDIAWRDTSGNTAVWLMSGAQVINSGVFGVVSTSWSIVGQRDFDGDGKHDFLWRDSSGNVAMWLLNGLQLLAAKVVANVATNWVIAGTGDFNGDFKGDILWRDSSTGAVAIWLMDSFNILQTVSLGSVTTNWVIAGTGDFNGDGGRDILWRDTTTGTVAIWFLDNRTRIIQTGSLGAVASNWVIVGTGDFNGDGISDILWRDASGNVAIWLMNGLQVAQSGIVDTVPSDFVAAETGDFDADGKSDVLWRATTKGAVVIWFMNGLQKPQAVNLGGVSLDWTIQGLNAD